MQSMRFGLIAQNIELYSTPIFVEINMILLINLIKTYILAILNAFYGHIHTFSKPKIIYFFNLFL